MQFDPIGNSLFVYAVICLLLTVQRRGITNAYSTRRIIALSELFGVLFTAFVAVQVWLGENAKSMLSKLAELMFEADLPQYQQGLRNNEQSDLGLFLLFALAVPSSPWYITFLFGSRRSKALVLSHQLCTLYL